jgi:hypothetical protein
VAGGEILDPLADHSGRLPRVDALLVGGGVGFSGSEWGNVLAGVTAAQFGVCRNG